MAIYNTNISGGLNTKDCTADASKILDGYTAAVGKEIVTGTMPDNGNVDSAIANGVLKEGYTSGGTIQNLSAGNIKSGVSIGGVTGTYKDEHSGILTFNIYNASSASSVRIYDRTGVIYTAPKPGNVSGVVNFVGNVILISQAINADVISTIEGLEDLNYTISDQWLFAVSSDNPKLILKR